MIDHTRMDEWELKEYISTSTDIDELQRIYSLIDMYALEQKTASKNDPRFKFPEHKAEFEQWLDYVEYVKKNIIDRIEHITTLGTTLGKYKKAIEKVGGVDTYIHAGMEKDAEACAIALQASARIINKYCGSKCRLLLGTTGAVIEMYYMRPEENRCGLSMKALEGVDVEFTKEEDNILYCEGHVDFKYREDNEDYIGFNNILSSPKKLKGLNPLIDTINKDVVLKKKLLTVLGLELKKVETVPHFYDPDEGKVTLSLLIKAKQGAVRG